MTQNDAPAPDMLVVYLLSDGYMIQFQGRQIAADTTVKTATKIKALLADRRKQIDQEARNPQPLTVLPTAQAQAQARAQGAARPQQTASQPQDGSREGAPTVQPQIDMTISRDNLRNLVARRIGGDIASDSVFYRAVAIYCPGIDEGEAMDLLDEAFVSSNQRESEQAPGQRDDDLVVAGIPGVRAGKVDHTLGLVDLNPGNVSLMVDDFVVDEDTGQVLNNDDLDGIAG